MNPSTYFELGESVNATYEDMMDCKVAQENLTFHYEDCAVAEEMFCHSTDTRMNRRNFRRLMRS